MALQNETKLNNGVTMPLQGYGVFQITDEAVCKEGVKAALAAGVRLIDTAACYGNERAVGTAIRESDVPRKDIFISSKVWIQDAGYEKTKASFAKTLENLGTDYLDLYLIHMPYGDYHGAWRAMEELYKAGKIRAIGVCNFLPDRLLDLILTHDVVPAVNQMETHPFCQQKKLREVMEPYIGAHYKKTPAQVILRWLLQENIIAIPKSVHEERIHQNYAIGDFALTADDIAKIHHMDRYKPLILDIASIDEVHRLHGITFEQ